MAIMLLSVLIRRDIAELDKTNSLSGYSLVKCEKKRGFQKIRANVKI